MKRFLQPKRLSSILSLFIFAVYFSLSSGILYWAYCTASASIEKELNNSLDYRYLLADKIIEGYLLQIGKSTGLIRSHLAFDPEVCHDPKHKHRHSLESHLGEHRFFDLDLLVVSRLDGTICADASSKRFELEALLPKIALDAFNLTGGRIKRLQHNHVDVTLLLHALPFIDGQSDETTGYIIGGQVLNNNLSFLEAIRIQTDSNAVILFKDGGLIGSTEPIFSSIVKAFLEIRKQRPANDGIVDIDSGKKLIGKELVFSFRPLKDNALEVGLLTSALPIFELRHTFWRSGIYLSLFVAFLIVVTTLSIRRIIARPLKNLLAYSDKVLAGNADARHQAGKISEFNTLGRIMERMVDKLNQSNEQLSLEIAERKQAEDRVKLINVQLDNRVKERTLELEEVNKALSNKIEEIEHTQQELRKLSKAIDQSGKVICIIYFTTKWAQSRCPTWVRLGFV